MSVPGRMVAFAAAGMSLAVGIQLVFLGQVADSAIGSGVNPSNRLHAEVGYAVLLLAALSLATGSQSSRFPCTPADVAWVYASPLPVGDVVAAQVVWQAARRCVFWVLGGAVVDVVGTVALDSPAGMFFSRAVLATPARASVGLGVVLGAAVLGPLLVELATGSAAGGRRRRRRPVSARPLRG